MSEVKHIPCIILPGIGQSKVELVDKKGEKIKMAWPLNVNGEELLGKLKAPLMKMMLFRKDAGFSDKVASIVEEIADPIASTPDGKPKNRLRTVSYPYSVAQCSENEKRFIFKMVPLQKLGEIIGEENLFFFSYNPFGDLDDLVAELNDYVQFVKKETGSEKVNFVSVSLGGVLSLAYFERFGHLNDVNRVMYFVAALRGTYIVSDLLDGKIKPENAMSVIKTLAGEKTAESLGGLLQMLPEGVFEITIEKILDVLKKTVLLNSSSMWGLVPPERYEELSQKYISDKSHSKLKEKTDRLFKYRENIENEFSNLEKNGVEFFAVCGYGLPLLPVVESEKMSSDGIINVSSASLGAVSADIGEKLLTESDNGKKCTNALHSHVSPDETLDASFGLWPERTWYFAGQSHDASAYNDKALEIATRVLSDTAFNSVYSDAELSQFGEMQDNRK